MGSISINSNEDYCDLIEEGALLVDVRSGGEFSGGSLPGAINLPLNNISNAEEILKHDDVIILYCVSGARSHSALNQLTEMGYGKVVDMGSFRNYICK
jgi:rhodanese-related sulfurtransferase